MRYPCPCCGYEVFSEGPGSYEICPICFWEDDAVQLEFAVNGGGANDASLIEAQRNFADFGASEEKVRRYVRPPSDIDRREAAWRPIDLQRDRFEDSNDPLALRAPKHDECLYYWRQTFWRNS